jgi:hypothetical protein
MASRCALNAVKRRGKMKRRAILTVIAVAISTLVLGGCAGVSVRLDDGKRNFETLGYTIGVYMKTKHESSALKTIPWVEGVMSLSDDEFLAQDPITVAYTFLMNEFPDDADMLMLVKATVDAFGVVIVVDETEEINKNKYVKMSKALLSGYLKGVK